MTEEELLAKLENSRSHVKQGKCRSADDVVLDMRKNMDYEVLVSEDAEKDLDNFIEYLLFVKRNDQVAKRLLDDFELTKQSLAHVAGSLKSCDNSKLNAHVR